MAASRDRAPAAAGARKAPVAAGARKAPLVIGCGALAVELVALTRRAGFPAVELTCLPASLHNRPERIPSAVRARIRRARAAGYDRLFVAYADCGTGGLLDRVLDEEGVARLEGAHCYEVYAGRAAFAALADEEPGTFYLTDFLVRNFERLVVRGLGLDRHPELLPIYFGHYRRVVYLAQTDDAELAGRAVAAAARLGLDVERRFVGLGELAGAVRAFVEDGPASDEHSRRETAAAGADRVGTRRSAQEAVVNRRPAPDPDGSSGPGVRNIRLTQEPGTIRRLTQERAAGRRLTQERAAGRRLTQERAARAAGTVLA